MLTDAATQSVVSRDGARLGYHQLGSGPALVVLHGSMEWSLSHLDVARTLADSFTVYLPDRRGRGHSGPYPVDYSLRTEIDDAAALLAATGAERVFGVSSGALIWLWAARELPQIRQAAIFEPPLFQDRATPSAVLDRFDREMAAGRLPAAMVTAMLGSRIGPAFLGRVPRRILERLTAFGMAREERNLTEGQLSMRTLAPTLHHDFALATELAGSVPDLRSVRADVLLLGGSRSPAYLKRALDDLQRVLPSVRRVEFPGLDHGATGNVERRGRPEVVAAELRRFFTGGR